jgi:hypothetical protein
MSIQDKLRELAAHHKAMAKSHAVHAEHSREISDHHKSLAKVHDGDVAKLHKGLAEHHLAKAEQHEADSESHASCAECMKTLTAELTKAVDFSKLAPLPAGFRIAPDRDRPDIRPGIAMVTRTGQQAVSAAAPIEFNMEKLFSIDRMDERDSEGGL